MFSYSRQSRHSRYAVSAGRLPSFRLFSRKERRCYNLYQSTMSSAEEVDEMENTAERKRCIRAIVLHILLVIALIAYTFIGAAIFQVIEKGAIKQEQVDLKAAKSSLLDAIWEANKNHTDKTDWMEAVENLLSTYDREVQHAVWRGINLDDNNTHSNHTVEETGWDFWESLFFVATIYTTIGYGHLSPITTAGRIATMVYALIGIPLCLLVLADLGGLIGELIKYCMRLCKRCFYGCRSEIVAHQQGNVDKLSGAAVFGCFSVIWVAYLLAAAAVYTLWEEWTYLESVYFLFISFSTIGFGDIFPQHPRYFILSFVLIFLGLALVSTGLTIIQQILQSTVNRATDELDAKLGIEASSTEDVKESVSLVEMNNTEIEPSAAQS